jgi:hypothetical protein
MKIEVKEHIISIKAAVGELPALIILQTPIGQLPFQQLARDLGTGARPKADFCHAISVFL